MKVRDHEQFKSIAKTTAMLLISTMTLTGCAVNPMDKKDDEDVYVKSNGSYIPYHSYIAKNGTIGSNTNFFTRSSDGQYASYKPSSTQLNSMRSGTFSGKVSRSVIGKSSASSSSVKSFGGSSVRVIGG